MYGRMRIGRCAGRKGIGCQANTIAIADELCSGKPACEIRVTHPEMDRILTCDKDYTRYLEASFHCQTGTRKLSQAVIMNAMSDALSPTVSDSVAADVNAIE